MPSAPERAQAITATVTRYLETVAVGSAEDLADFYADDATLEDPVGGEVHIGRQAIRGFYAAVQNMKRECELVSLRVSGREAAFQFKLTLRAPDGHGMVIEPIEVMAFDDDGKVTSMRAYWSAADVTQV